MERRAQTDKFSTAYETAHRKEKVDVQHKKEHNYDTMSRPIIKNLK